MDVGLTVLLSQLRARGITLDLAPDDTFAFIHNAVLEPWKMYGDNLHLDFLRPTPRDVAVRRTLRAQVRGQRMTQNAECSSIETGAYTWSQLHSEWESVEGDFIEGDFIEGDFIEGDFIEGDFIEGDFSAGDLAESRVTMSCGASTGAATAMLAKAAIIKSAGRMLRSWLY
ncbi:hypothetical protein E4U61_004195 [Claviceps capensis]|nr:hypothetical protein E4U61_004195 [Claviceps capensis]